MNQGLREEWLAIDAIEISHYTIYKIITDMNYLSGREDAFAHRVSEMQAQLISLWPPGVSQTVARYLYKFWYHKPIRKYILSSELL